MRPYQLRSIYDVLGKTDIVLRNAIRLGIFLALCIGPYEVLQFAGEPGFDLFLLVMGLLFVLTAVMPYCILCHMALQEWYSLPRRAAGFLAVCAIGHAMFMVWSGGLIGLSVESAPVFGFTIFGFTVVLPSISAASIYARVRIIEDNPEWAVQSE